MKVCTGEKEETPYTMSKYPNFLAVWIKLDHILFPNGFLVFFFTKKRKSADQRKTFISVCYSSLPQRPPHPLFRPDCRCTQLVTYY